MQHIFYLIYLHFPTEKHQHSIKDFKRKNNKCSRLLSREDISLGLTKLINLCFRYIYLYTELDVLKANGKLS